MAVLKLADLEKLIQEVVVEDKASKLFTDIRSENEKESKNVEKDSEERIKDSTPTKSSTQIDGYRGEDAPSGRNALNLNYDRIDDKYQARVKALVSGKASPNQADIDDEAAGISTKGNKDFYEKAQKDNKKYADKIGANYLNNRISHPPKTSQFATEGKVKVGDVFKESKNNLQLQVTGLNETKTRVSFIDESGKKYSLAIENFKKAVKESKMIRECGDAVKEWAPVAAKAAGALGKSGAGKAAARQACADVATDAAVSASSSDGEKEGVQEAKIKRLKFNKTVFLSESHVKTLIPEQYKIPGNKIAMIDKEDNEYLMQCDGYKQAIVLEYKNLTKAKKDFEKMKRLWEYNTRLAVGGTLMNEAEAQKELYMKTKKLLRKKPIQ